MAGRRTRESRRKGTTSAETLNADDPTGYRLGTTKPLGLPFESHPLAFTSTLLDDL